MGDARGWHILELREKFRFVVKRKTEPLELFGSQNMKIAFQMIDLVAKCCVAWGGLRREGAIALQLSCETVKPRMGEWVQKEGKGQIQETFRRRKR